MSANANVATRTSASEGASSAQAQATPAITPEVATQLGVLRSRLQLYTGQVVLAMLNLARYRHHAIADLQHLLLEPLVRDRIAIGHKTTKAADGTLNVEQHTIGGIAIWATVSDAVDAKITEQAKAGAFPVRLGAEDWTSGETVWLLDVIAEDARQATSLLASFRQLAGERVVKIHPMVGGMIEPEVLEKLKGAQGQGVAAKTG